MSLDPGASTTFAEPGMAPDRLGLADLQVAGDQEQDVGPPLGQGSVQRMGGSCRVG